jgi:NAD dependent epimerase/dehydratase family enzyme
MKEADIKINRNGEFIRQHTLTPEQRQRLIQDKLERARQIAQALLKREVAFQSR